RRRLRQTLRFPTVLRVIPTTLHRRSADYPDRSAHRSRRRSHRDKELFECFAAIERAINTAFFVRPVGVTRHGHENAIRIFWIDSDLRDLLTVPQSQMCPCLAGVR